MQGVRHLPALMRIHFRHSLSLRLAAVLLCLCCLDVAAQALPPTVVEALSRTEIPPQAVGLYVSPVDGGDALQALNPDLPLQPASTMKLVTTYAALETLGPTFQWQTDAYARGALADGVLHGDLIIRGSGDPKLVLENFWLFLRRLRAAGIADIRGDVILDRSAFAPMVHDAAAFDGDPLRPYNVGPDALLLNYKTLALRFVPDPQRGIVRVQSEPPLAAFPIEALRLVEGECGDWRARLGMEIGELGVRFNGGYALSCGEQGWQLHPYPISHTRYFDLMFRRMWADLGGFVRGRVRDGSLPVDAWPVAQWRSPPLSELVRDINKFSNNVMARQVLLSIAQRETGLPADPVQGAAAVRAWLRGKGIDANELVIDNGSGLSRGERISARMLARMLVAAYRAPLMPEFIASLPLVGLDGTMRRRLLDQPVAGRAHIKTGRLDDVRAIAGYVLAASGRRYAVVCLINHANVERAGEVQDALLQWIYERG